MGLDAFTSDNDEPEDDESEEQHTEGEFPSKQRIANVVRDKALNSDINIEVDGQELTGDTEDFALLFALMFLDIEDADPYQINDES